MIHQAKLMMFVDRSKPVAYPLSVQAPLFVEEEYGPARYKLSHVIQWTHSLQAIGSVAASVVYDRLVQVNALQYSLGLQDGMIIRRKGIKVFRSVFGGRSLFLPRAAVQCRDHSFRAPLLDGCGRSVKIHWISLGAGLNSHNVVGLFPEFREVLGNRKVPLLDVA